MDRSLPQASPTLAQAVWARQRQPSARSVARAMSAAGFPVHYVTVARWRAQNWRPVEADHPLEAAHAALDAAAPLVTGDPRTTIDDLVARAGDADSLAAKSDGELLRSAVRELLIALIVLTRALTQKAAELVTDKPGDLAAGLRAIATAFTAATKALAQALDLDRAAP